MPAKEAKARIKINKLLETAGWRFFDNEHGPANILRKAPQQVKDFFQTLKDEHKEVVAITAEGLQLAQNYIKENVVGQTSLNDCLHIATATLNKVDVLVSWNFKHIVNVYRI